VNVCCVVFRWVIAKVFLTKLIIHLEVLLCFYIQEPEISHFHCMGMLLFDSVIAMSTVVVLLMWMSGGGCGCPSSLRVRRRTLASWALRKRAPNSASAVDVATSLRMVQVMWILPLSLIGLLSMGKLPRKKLPPARLRV
jgi:hypothetical protein